MNFERFQELQQRDRQERSGRRPPAMRDERDPEHWVYPMPTVDEVVAAGYPPSYHEAVAKERAELVRRFLADAQWRAEYIAALRAQRGAE